MTIENTAVGLAGWRRCNAVRVSVALCTRNGARWIGPLLESLSAQTVPPGEVIVADDCSDDDTVAIIEAWSRTVPFRVEVSVNPVRLGSTMNFAQVLTRCSGTYIALADQDDVWYPAKLARLLGEMESDPTLTLAFSDADLIGEDGRPLGGHLWRTRLVERTLRRNAVVSEGLFARKALTTGCTMMIRRRVVEAALPFPDVLTDTSAPMRHDRWLSLVAAAVGTVRALPEPLLGFRVHPHQETGVLVGRQLFDALVASAARVLRSPDPAGSAGRRARATQLGVAAERADLLGDFDEARTLRRIAELILMRAEPAPSVRGGLARVVRCFRAGVYEPDLLGAGAAGADVIRALGQPLWARGNGNSS